MSLPDTLSAAIVAAAERAPQRGYTFVSDDGVPGFSSSKKAHESTFSFAAIERTSARYGGALQALGLRKGARVALILPQNEDFVLMFFGALRAGIIPVPIYPPLGLGQLQGYLDNTRHILDKCGAEVLITTAQIKRLLGAVQAACPQLRHIAAIEDLRDADAALRPVQIDADDVAFLQFTSGSTSRPKGVRLTHANLLANIKCIMQDGLQISEQDVGISWLPLFHDMGLIGFVLAPLVYTVPIAFLPSLTFLKRPVSWFHAITKYRGSIAFAPNFAYALSVKRIREEELAGLDLSSWRVAGCGAEPIRAETLEQFVAAFGKVGFRKQALLPAYGMAESSLAVTFERGLKTLCIDSERLYAEQRAHVVAEEAPNAARLVSCGEGFPDHKFAVFAASDAASETPLSHGEVGEIRISGPSVMSGYWEDDEKTREAFAGGWLRTGDLGFVYDKQLYVCGRSKEVIIVNGRNYYPQDIEWEVSKVAGVRKGNVIAFGARPEGAEREQVVVAFELQLEGSPSAEQVAEAGHALSAQVRAAVQQGMNLSVDDIVPLAPGVLPKTSSGKLQRAGARALYEQGALSSRRSAREQDRVGLLKEAAKSQLSFLKLAVQNKLKR